MHTAFALRQSMFAIEVEGAPADRRALFLAHRHERLGVVVTSPLGGLGAAFMIQLAVTAYYDADPSRLGNPHYPEIYVFHVGGMWGEYSLLDVWPARKQVSVSADGGQILAAINDYAITHLLLPDEDFGPSMLDWVDPNAALDRLEHCFLYHPSGRVSAANVSISATDSAVFNDIADTIDLQIALPRLLADYPDPEIPAEKRDNDNWIQHVSNRQYDVNDADRAIARRRRIKLQASSHSTETYREISAKEALGKLGHLHD